VHTQSIARQDVHVADFPYRPAQARKETQHAPFVSFRAQAESFDIGLEAPDIRTQVMSVLNARPFGHFFEKLSELANRLCTRFGFSAVTSSKNYTALQC
jgi:hypothetical protein